MDIVDEPFAMAFRLIEKRREIRRFIALRVHAIAVTECFCGGMPRRV